MKATLYTIVTVACLVSFIQGCAMKEKSLDVYTCGSDGYWWTKKNDKLVPYKKGKEKLSCIDHRVTSEG